LADQLLLLDTGDALVSGAALDGERTREPGQPLFAYHPLGDRTEGKAVVAGMNLMGYDAMALGPKDLALGVNVLRQRMAEAEFAIVSANVLVAHSGELLAPAYTLVQVGSQRLGILGLTRPPLRDLAGLEVEDPKTAVARWLPEVTRQADLVIVLTNLDFRTAAGLVSEVQGVDLLVGALPGQLPSTALRVPETGTLAVTAEQSMTAHSGRRVGELVLVVQADGSLGVQSWRSVEMSALYVDDLAMQLLLGGYQ
jgi:2',3'-cyclic-nucleotide 2'-phosphodiesterase (5'-nucleotidase family)